MVYGFGSESVHASWGHSMNFDLFENEDGSYSARPISMPAEIRYVCPIIEFCNPAFVGWSERIDIKEFNYCLKFIASINQKLFHAFDELYSPHDG